MGFKFRLGLLVLGLFVLSGSSITPKHLEIKDVLSSLNSDRALHGLAALNLDPTLNLAALAKAKDMAMKDYFAHTSPDGLDPWHWFNVLGYEYLYAGENLAQGFDDPRELEDHFMASVSHRANILSPFYSQVGLAVVNVKNTTVVVQLFGTKENKVTLRQ